ncbi:MAG: hypothetical protein LBQ64_01830 [Bacteroidales bacterium]|jgi:hypothetical protein|nr:hypothetical protein [Bacteroidales bacterium]
MNKYINKRFSRLGMRTFQHPPFPSGTGIDDFNDGKWIELSEAQIAFAEANPKASGTEILNMQLYVPPPPPVPSYGELVSQYIREQYSIDDELAILRQREEKPDKFAEYDNYCEQCKTRAKIVLNSDLSD